MLTGPQRGLKTTPCKIRPGVLLWRSLLSRQEQTTLLSEVLARVARAPFFRPTMPRSGKPLSVEMTNFGALGWVSDQASGYRYELRHPVTGNIWPDIPPILLSLWGELTSYRDVPEACLVNLYKGKARMGLHQDRDEAALEAPVMSISLGDDAVFRLGGPKRTERTSSFILASGDVLLLGGAARLCRHGIDRILEGSSELVPEGGRINLTLRRVNPSKNETAGQ
jgi:alkylated DNA repair protein (DNA oxidative demethylase)